LLIIIAQSLEYDNLKDFTFYRIRVVNETDKPINEKTPDSFTYPPICDDFSISRGRANLKGEQVFYASGDSHTPFHELSKFILPGKSIVYLSKWRFKSIPPNTYMRSLFFGIDDTKEESYASIMARGINEQYLNMCKTLPYNLQEIFLYYQKKYAELFTFPDDNHYHISSAIAHNFFKSIKSEKFDAPIITYPSIAKKMNSVNFAIRKDFVDNHLHLIEVDKIIVTKIAEKENSYIPIQRGVHKNGILEWLDFKVNVTIEENELMVSYDKITFKAMSASDTLTSSCSKHTFNTKEFLNINQITEKNIRENIRNSTFQNFDFKLKNSFYLFAELDQDVFLSSELSAQKAIRWVKVPVSIEFSYELN